MLLNHSNLEFELQKKIRTLTKPEDILLAAKVIAYLKTNPVNVVTSFSTLPDISLVPNSSLYFVESELTLYVADKTRFSGIWRKAVDNVLSKIFAWGNNSNGQLGDSTVTSRLSPVMASDLMTNSWKSVSAGAAHTIAVRTDGTLWTWGCNGSGRLGDNTTINKSSPVSVVGGFTDWCQVSASGFHTAAVRTNGTLWSWGCNTCGMLGDNTTTNRSSPVSVVGGVTNWCQVSAGCTHTAAVRTNGTIWSWGCNGNGRLGDNTVVDRSSPVSVVGGFTDWCRVSAGCGHAVSIRARTKGF